MMLLEEMASIFLTPYLLLFVVPKVSLLYEFVSILTSEHWDGSSYVLIQSLIMQRVDDILQFIADFTVHVEGVGHVCRLVFHIYQHHKRICHLLKNFVTSDYRVVAFSYLDSDNSYGILLFFFFFFPYFCGSFSAFDFQKHGNSKYGSPDNASRAGRSSQGKMEKSFLR